MATIGLKAIYTGIKLPNGSVALDDQGVNLTGIFEIDTNKEHGASTGTKESNTAKDTKDSAKSDTTQQKAGK